MASTLLNLQPVTATAKTARMIRIIRPGTVSTVQYNHYSLLRTVEDIFALPHLGDAAMPQVSSFGAEVFG